MDSWLSTAWFVLLAVVTSLSGVLSPGAMTAAALAAGTRRRHAGALLAVGHGIVELPLMVLLVAAGAGGLFASATFQIVVGLIGGAMLLWMGVSMLRGVAGPAGSAGSAAPAPARLARGVIVTGVILTAGNPMFLVWWSTVGLNLTFQAANLGIAAFVAFAVIHWLCDLLWLEALTLAAFKGSDVLGPKAQRAVLIVCGVALLLIGGKFLLDAAGQAIGL